MNDPELIVELVRYQLGIRDNLDDFNLQELYEANLIRKNFATGEIEVDLLKTAPEPVDVDELEEYLPTFRSKFSAHPNLKGNKGSKAKVYERLHWFMNETGLSIEEIDKVTDIYIQECVKLNRYLLDPHYFIWKSESSRKRTLIDSKLWSVYEDYIDSDEEQGVYEL